MISSQAGSCTERRELPFEFTCEDLLLLQEL